MKTIDLRAYRNNPHAPAAIFAGVLLVLILLNGLAEWRAPTTTTTTTPTPALIYVLSTREPPQQPTADPRLAEIDALKARLAELEARQQAQSIYRQMVVDSAPTQAGPGYTAHTDQGPVFVPDNATPVPADQPYIGPFLAPVATEQPLAGPRLCTGFGDGRDYDPMYEASPVCHQAAP